MTVSPHLQQQIEFLVEIDKRVEWVFASQPRDIRSQMTYIVQFLKCRVDTAAAGEIPRDLDDPRIS